MIAAQLLIGLGVILVALGVLFLKTHFSRKASNDELEWFGFGEHPFRKR